MLENRFIRISLILLLGIVIPSFSFLFFPDLITDFGSYITPDTFIFLVLGILFLFLYFYICMIGAYRIPILPLCVLFFYQMFQYLLNLFSPITFNYRILVILFIIPVLVIVFRKNGFKDYLYPFLGLFLFYLMNVFYTFINYAHTPNFLYNLNLYLQKKDSILPTIYAVDIVIFLTFLVIGVYLGINLTKDNNKKINFQMSMILTYFFIIAASISIVGYVISDLHFVEVVGGIQRLKGVSSNSNLLGFLNVCISLYLVRFLIFTKDDIQKILVKLALILIYITTILTFSRTNIAFLTIIHLFNFVVLSKNRTETAIRVSLISAILVVVFFVMDFTFSWGILERMQLRLSDEQSNQFRPMVLEYLFSQQGVDWSILIGHGIAAASNTLFTLFSSQFYIADLPIVYHPHNSYVQLFFDYGLLGLYFYVSTLVAIGFKAMKDALVSNMMNINSLLLFELIAFAMVASLVDGYLLNVEIIPFWIILSIMYVNTLIVGRRKNADD